jgi:hypothetical protein
MATLNRILKASGIINGRTQTVTADVMLILSPFFKNIKIYQAVPDT